MLRQWYCYWTLPMVITVCLYNIYTLHFVRIILKNDVRYRLMNIYLKNNSRNVVRYRLMNISVSSLELTTLCCWRTLLSKLYLRSRPYVRVIEIRVVARSGTERCSFSTLYVWRQPKSCTSFSATSAHRGPTPLPCWQLSNISLLRHHPVHTRTHAHF